MLIIKCKKYAQFSIEGKNVHINYENITTNEIYYVQTHEVLVKVKEFFSQFYKKI